MQRELDGSREQECNHRRSIHIHPYTHSYMRARTDIGAAAAAQNAAHALATDRAQSAAVRAKPEAVHTPRNVVTEAVFHAPMFALKADAESKACEPRPRRSAEA